jgi:hypothetical protein
MIVPTMTVQEIHINVSEDLKTVDKIVNGFKKDFRKLVLRKSGYHTYL